VPGNRIGYVTAALMRSMAMASADPNIGSYTIPDFNIGWGRLDADSVLYFTGDTRRLLIVDDTTGVATGEYKETRFRVNSAIPLRVCLAWTDTAAAPSANPTLVNDLNLELTTPGGTQYRGNKYSSGQSQPNPSGWDNVNVEECARVNAPDTGLWTLRVYGQNVATHVRQWFAWTITGDVALPAATHDVGATAIVAPADTVDSGVVVTPEATVENFGTAQETFVARFTIADGYEDTVHVTLPAGRSQPACSQYAARPNCWVMRTRPMTPRTARLWSYRRPASRSSPGFPWPSLWTGSRLTRSRARPQSASESRAARTWA
jgi:hypothetical protein